VRAQEDPDCSSAQVVRLVFSDALGPADPQVVEQIVVALGDGTRIAPRAIADHAALGQESGRDDNVLDLCVESSAAVAEVVLAEALLRDRAGHPTASVRFRVPRSAPPGQESS
jgi:hypothetical protein